MLQRIISSPIFLKLKAYVGSCFFEKLKDLLAGCQPRLDTRQSFPTHLSVSFDLSKLSDSTKNSYSWCDDKQTNNKDCIYWPLRFCLLFTNISAFILLVINLKNTDWENEIIYNYKFSSNITNFIFKGIIIYFLIFSYRIQ